MIASCLSSQVYGKLVRCGTALVADTRPLARRVSRAPPWPGRRVGNATAKPIMPIRPILAQLTRSESTTPSAAPPRALTPRSALAVLLSTSLVALGACGGGGGGGGSGASNEPAASTETPATPDIGASTNTVTSGTPPPEDLSASPEACTKRAALPATTLINRDNYVDLANGALETLTGHAVADRILRRFLSDAHYRGIAGSPQLLVCDAGSIDRAYFGGTGDGLIAAGDTLRVTFNQCQQNGVVRNGSIEGGNLHYSPAGTTLRTLYHNAIIDGYSEVAVGAPAPTWRVDRVEAGFGTVVTTAGANGMQGVTSTDFRMTRTDGDSRTQLTGRDLENASLAFSWKAGDAETNYLSTRPNEAVNYTVLGSVPTENFTVGLSIDNSERFVAIADGPYLGGTFTLRAADGSVARLHRETATRSRISLDVNGDDTVEQSCLAN